MVGRATFAFDLPEAGAVTVRVFDALGREVARLADAEMMNAGTQHLEWNPAGLPSGVYVYRVRWQDQERTGRVVLTQ